MGFNTKAVHTGVAKDTQYNSVTTPLYTSSNFAFKNMSTTTGYDYTRSGNPTRRAAEENIAELEGGVDARCTATGMSAVTGVLHLLKTGDHVIAGNDIYGGTFRLMHTLFSKMGIQFSFIDMRSPQHVEDALRDNTKMVWIETPSNPLLNIVDIQAVARIARKHGALSAVDNTFMTPYFQKPLALGADLVVHSTTKYINGHSDVIGGAIVSATDALAQQIQFNVNALGISEAPFDAWLVLRGVKTLGIRMEQHTRNAMAIAQFLAQCDKVETTYYPGLKTHPQHELAKQQMSGFGGMVSFDFKPNGINLDTFFSKLRYFALAESLGGVESLIEAPYFMSHASMTEEARKEAGIKKNNVRLSIGIEDTDDLLDDLKNALS
ncbi:MAG: PLP-dependent transferase [Deltaproteobacteria bacterium]|nr:PLP-dependent transferase [Deltaproteobacteria bacterium]MBN2671941.1 PLP-dependent transferase [Deltaproteobacteria bacterium]